MDQIKTGGFIAAKRKEKGLTQRELADRLGISDKTVSKWECGKGMPELSLMQPLCRELGFSVNELLSGETLDDDYREKAEQNLLQLIDERKQAPARWKTAAVLAGCFAAAAGLWFLLLVNSDRRRPMADAADAAISGGRLSAHLCCYDSGWSGGALQKVSADDGRHLGVGARLPVSFSLL